VRSPARIDDPETVRREYATDAGLARRIAAYRFAEGPDAREVTFAAVSEARPGRVLEVGCGQGVLAERIASELGAAIVAIDQSEHMVELTRARGVTAQVGDVQELPLRDAEFDVAVAAWMLYHVPDVDRALAELARVLVPGGRLVAVTNAAAHLDELADLLGVTREPTGFSGENGERLLRRHFARVERREAFGSIVFPGRREAQEFVDATVVLSGPGRELPDFEGPLRVTRAPVIFVAERS
jgi:SAM-dependent methyltransferase